MVCKEHLEMGVRFIHYLFIVSFSGNILMLSVVGSTLCMVCREHQKMSEIYTLSVCLLSPCLATS